MVIQKYHSQRDLPDLPDLVIGVVCSQHGDGQARARAYESAAIAFVRGIKPGGSTAAVPALRLAYRAGAARVVLLSDGLANTGGGGDALLAEAHGAMRAGIRFDTVGLGIDQDSQLLTALAAESGGVAIKR